MNKHFKRFVSGAIVLALFVGTFTGCTFSEPETVDVKSKVHFEGVKVGECETSLEIADVINDEDDEMSTNLIIELDNYWEAHEKSMVNEKEYIEDIQHKLLEHRKMAKAYYTKTNNEILSKMDTSNFDMSFRADSYAPYIVARFNNKITSEDIDNIYKLAEEEKITNIYVQTVKELESELSSAIDAIDGTKIVSDAIYDGTGVVVGILDMGLVKVIYDEFNGVEIVHRNEWWYDEEESDHATAVAACAVAVAPGATYLSVDWDGGDIHGEVEWMLERGVNIINISLGMYESGEAGTYTSYSAYCDYIAREYSVVFTGSAGNRAYENGDAMVTPPNGYNTITVGACNDFGIRREDSSFEEKFTINFPNLLAPGSNITLPSGNTRGGTSLASPIVAGTAAVIMQKAPYLLLHPECVMAILMATTERIDAYARSSGFDDEAGTGMLNLANAVDSCRMCTFFENSDNQTGEFVSTRSFYLTKGQRIRVAFVSLINNGSADVSTQLVTDYDLYLYNKNNNVVASCMSLYNNEFIDYEVQENGYYTIKIKQYSNKKTGYADKCAYAYFVSEE